MSQDKCLTQSAHLGASIAFCHHMDALNLDLLPKCLYQQTKIGILVDIDSYIMAPGHVIVTYTDYVVANEPLQPPCKKSRA
jgi:hypothetical protein